MQKRSSSPARLAGLPPEAFAGLLPEGFAVSPRMQAEAFRVEQRLVWLDKLIDAARLGDALRNSIVRLESLAALCLEGSRPPLDVLLRLELASDRGASSPLAGNPQSLVLGIASEADRKAAFDTLCCMAAFLETSRFVDDRIDEAKAKAVFSLALKGPDAWTEDAEAAREPSTANARDGASALLASIDGDAFRKTCQFMNEDFYSPLVQSAIARWIASPNGPLALGIPEAGRLSVLAGHLLLKRRGIMRSTVVPCNLGAVFGPRMREAFEGRGSRAERGPRTRHGRNSQASGHGKTAPPPPCRQKSRSAAMPKKTPRRICRNG